MKLKQKFTPLQITIFSILGILILSSVSSLHPITAVGGYTGAPGDSLCASCHGGSNPNLDGSISIQGVPSVVSPNETYPLTITVSNPNGNAVRAGFQIVALQGNNTNAGSFSNNSNNSQFRVASGKTYLGHAPAVNFGASNEISWTVDWTAPASAANNEITFYGGSIIANGNGSTSGDIFRTTSVPVSLQASDPLTVEIINIVEPDCSFTNEGSAEADPSGGTPPYQYLWSNGQTTRVATSLFSDNYTVTVTDSDNNTVTASVFIDAPDEIIPQIEVTDALCNGEANGQVSIQAFGGTPPYNYFWPDGVNASERNDLAAGPYTVTITDAASCDFFIDLQINEAPAINIIASEELSITCFGANDGFLFVQAAGGTGSLNYSWSNGSFGQTISNLSAGSYTVSIEDQNQCQITQNFIIEEPEVLTADFSNTTDPTCDIASDGSLTAQASGGTGNYSFLWSNGASSQTISNLEVGHYSVTISDENECTVSISQNLSSVPVPIISFTSFENPSECGAADGQILIEHESISPVVFSVDGGLTWQDDFQFLNLNSGAYIAVVSIDEHPICRDTQSVSLIADGELSIELIELSDESCEAAQNGSIGITVEGGSGNYIYNWSNGGTEASISGLSSGAYSLIVTDADGCVGQFSAEISSLPFPDITLTVNNISCHSLSDGTASASIQEGFDEYSLLWSDGTMTNSLEDLNEGAYFVLAIASDGCATDTLSFSITEPDSIAIDSLSIMDVLCFGDSTGSIFVSAMGGTGNLLYEWNEILEGPELTMLAAGEYNLIITDENNCNTSFTVNLTESDELLVSQLELQEPLCFDGTGSIEISATGGTAPYSILWDTDDQSFDLNDVAAGDYSYTITDSNSCLFTGQLTLSQPDEIRIFLNLQSETEPGAMDGSASAEISGGTGTLNIQWSTGAANSMIDSLSAGEYSITVTDENNCSSIRQFIINEGECLLEAEAEISHPLCNGSEDGSITLIISNFNGAVSINFSGEETMPTSLTALSADTYSISITDEAGCVVVIEEITLLDQDAIMMEIIQLIPATGPQNADGAILNMLSGGTGLLTFQWFDSNEMLVSEEQEPDQLLPGTYSVIIRDENDCSVEYNDIVIDFITSTDDQGIARVSVFPNPASEQLNIFTIAENYAIRVFDAQGSLILSQGASYDTILDISRWTSGLYHLVLILDGQTQNFRVVKQ
jgi:hypothetical protein